jgi:TonB family protein
LNLKHSAFTWTLYALVQEGKARVLSRPRLACQSGKEAELLVGGEKPIITTQVVSGGASGTSVEYKEYGIKLKIKPTVSEQERIKLVLNVEVSEVEDAVTIGGTNTTALAYPLKKRTAATELFLNDGQTMAIGGLMRQKSQEDITKTPGLGDIPIVGMLFRKKVSSIGGGTGEKGDTELFITITPTIVSKKTPEPKSVVSLEKTAPQAVVSLESRNIPPNLENYVRAVQTKIVTAAYYPLSAREAGWEGDVKLNLNLASNGDLKEIKILQSSGYKVLDDAALAVAKKQSPYPPFPPQIESQELWVVVPITYRKN